MPSPSEAALALAKTLSNAWCPEADEESIAESLDTFAAARVAEARAEMRERCAKVCAERHYGHCTLCTDCRIRRHLKESIRALPLSPNPETTK